MVFINFLITMLVLFLSNKFFPEYVYINEPKTIILIALFMIGLSILYSICYFVSKLLMLVGIGFITTPILWIVSLFLIPIQLYILNNSMSGFELHGFWTYVALSLVFWLLNCTSYKK